MVIFVSVPLTTWKDKIYSITIFINKAYSIYFIYVLDKRKVVHSVILNYGHDMVEKIIYSFMFLLRSELPMVFFFIFLKVSIQSAVLLVFFCIDFVLINSLLCSIQVFLACWSIFMKSVQWLILVKVIHNNG